MLSQNRKIAEYSFVFLMNLKFNEKTIDVNCGERNHAVPWDQNYAESQKANFTGEAFFGYFQFLFSNLEVFSKWNKHVTSLVLSTIE